MRFRDIMDETMKQIGRYEIERELGRGAMGVVYAAVDPLIGRQVAIKTIRLGALEAEADHAELKQRLRREARAAGVLSHSGIITVYDVGEHEEDAFIVMEYIDGKTVEELLASGAVQHSDTLLSLLHKTAEALDYAHSKGIIHRDIKPSNIMVCRDGAVKVADFGVAKLAASSSMTQSGFVLGTPSYMSPEQAQGRSIDGRSDQFSLAVVAYRMLTGKLPFEGPTLTALLAKILWEEPEYEKAGLRLPVRPVFEKALAKDPQFRYPSCTNFVQELEAAYAKSKVTASSAQPLHAKDESLSTEPNIIRVETASSVMQAPEARTDIENRSGAIYSAPPVPAAAAQKTRSKSLIIVWMAVLGIVLLAAVAFFSFKALKLPAPDETRISTEAPEIPMDEPVKIAPLSEPLNPPQETETVVASPPPSQPAELKKAAVPDISVPKPKAQEFPAAKPQPESGVVTWSGSLEKNSILVITEQSATIGSIEGRLPGKPVRIEVEPEALLIRQQPGESNRWSQIILYSGNQKCSSITIRWMLIK